MRLENSEVPLFLKSSWLGTGNCFIWRRLFLKKFGELRKARWVPCKHPLASPSQGVSWKLVGWGPWWPHSCWAGWWYHEDRRYNEGGREVFLQPYQNILSPLSPGRFLSSDSPTSHLSHVSHLCMGSFGGCEVSHGGAWTPAEPSLGLRRARGGVISRLVLPAGAHRRQAFKPHTGELCWLLTILGLLFLRVAFLNSSLHFSENYLQMEIFLLTFLAIPKAPEICPLLGVNSLAAVPVTGNRGVFVRWRFITGAARKNPGHHSISEYKSVSRRFPFSNET